MGVFLNVLICPKQGRNAVQRVLDGLDPALMLQSQLDPAQFQWLEQERGTLLQLGDCLPYEQLPQAVSRGLDGTAMLCYIYDDDFWGYELYHRGEWVDTFWTVPDCFQPVDPRLLRHSQEERARLLARHFQAEAAEVREYLVPWTQADLDGDGELAYPGDASPRGDCWQLGDFLHRLGNWDMGELEADQEPEPDQELEPDPPLGTNGPDPGNRIFYPVWTPPAPQPEPRWEELKIEKCLPQLTGVRLRPSGGPEAAVDIPSLDGPALEGLLEDFYAGRLAQLELDFTLQGEGVYVKRLKKKVYQPFHLTLELLREGGRCLCVCFDDQKFYVYWLIADRGGYFDQECEEHEMTTLAGRRVEAYLVHHGPQAIRQELPILLSHLHRREEVFNCISRMGVWRNEYHYRDKKKHQQLREQWCLSPG